MTLHSFLTQVGTLLVIGVISLLALRWTNRRPSDVRKRLINDSPQQAKPRPSTRLLVDETWTPEQCAEVFDQLTTGEEVHFFAADVPSPSDPGGYVTVARDVQDNLIRWVGNHGWSSDWKQVSLTELRDELYRNRAAQTTLIQETTIHEAYRLEKVETR